MGGEGEDESIDFDRTVGCRREADENVGNKNARPLAKIVRVEKDIMVERNEVEEALQNTGEDFSFTKCQNRFEYRNLFERL